MQRHFRVAAAAACTTLLLLGGCGKPPAPTTPGASASNSAPGNGSAGNPTPTRPNPTSAPTDLPTGQEFTLDQAARYDDGVQVEVSTIKKAMANSQQQGADETGGQIVIAEILVTNGSAKPVDASAIQVFGYYNQVGAPKIVDSTKQLGDSFTGTIPPGGQAKALMGFAMPHDQLDKVTIMVDGGAPDHGAVQFTGKVS